MRVIIVDDEKPARLRLTKLLNETAAASKIPLEIVAEGENGKEALTLCLGQKPDVVFLDIEMPLLSGLEAAAILADTDTMVVFVTAYDQYAMKAFEAKAIDYLLKPVEKDRLTQTLLRLGEQVAKNSRPKLAEAVQDLVVQDRLTRIAVRSGNKIEVIPFDEISLIKATDGYSEIYFGEKKLLSEDPLDQFERRLGTTFMRIHRSTIINLNFLKELVREGDRKYNARLKDYFENEVAVSRESLKKLQDSLGW